MDESQKLTGRMLASVCCSLELLSIGVALLDKEGCLVYTNAALLALFPKLAEKKAHLQCPLTDWVPEGSDTAQQIMVALQQGHSFQGECNYISREGSHTLSFIVMPDHIAVGEQVTYALVLVRNADEHRRAEVAEAQLERKRIMMESIGTICHAIGQPATVLMSSIEMMQLGILDDSTTQETLKMCYEAVLEIRDLLRQLSEKRHYITESYLQNKVDNTTILKLDKK